MSTLDEDMVCLLGGDQMARRVALALQRGDVWTPEQLVAADPYDIKDIRWMGPESYRRAMELRGRLIDAQKEETQ